MKVEMKVPELELCDSGLTGHGGHSWVHDWSQVAGSEAPRVGLSWRYSLCVPSPLQVPESLPQMGGVLKRWGAMGEVEHADSCLVLAPDRILTCLQCAICLGTLSFFLHFAQIETWVQHPPLVSHSLSLLLASTTLSLLWSLTRGRVGPLWTCRVIQERAVGKQPSSATLGCFWGAACVSASKKATVTLLPPQPWQP